MLCSTTRSDIGIVDTDELVELAERGDADLASSNGRDGDTDFGVAIRSAIGASLKRGRRPDRGRPEVSRSASLDGMLRSTSEGATVPSDGLAERDDDAGRTRIC